jgi:hypothetical protein
MDRNEGDLELDDGAKRQTVAAPNYLPIFPLGDSP